MPEFEDLPFNERPDLSPYVIHLTKNTKVENKHSAFENLRSILMHGNIWGSDKDKGFIKGKNKATCFMDIPLASLKYLLNRENTDPDHPRYEPFGIIVSKKLAYKKGCRPVLYLSNSESKRLGIPPEDPVVLVTMEIDPVVA